MDLMTWISSFGKMHERARKGGLAADEQKVYLAGRDELARAMVAAQKVTLKPGQSPRDVLKVGRALQIDLDVATGRVRAMTLELSRTGFTTLLAKAPPPTEAPGFTLKVPGQTDPLIGRCKAIEAAPRTGSVLVTFAFQELTEPSIELLESLVIDSLLERFRNG